MYHFPYLTSFLKKNEKCRGFFQNSFKWGSSTVTVADGLRKAEEKQVGESEDNFRNIKCISTRDAEESTVQKLTHWKKAVYLRFEAERVKSEGDGFHSPFGKVKGKERGSNSSPVRNYFDLSSLCLSTTTATAVNADACSKICRLCDKTFPSRALLNEHKSRVHFPSQGSKKEFCYVPYFYEPKRFEKGKRQDGQLECTLCKNLFTGLDANVEIYLEDLKNKVKERETPSKGKGRPKCKSMARRVCELCSKILSNRKGLERHMLIHTGEKPFPCDVCGKPFRRKDNCVRHKKTAHLFKKPRKPRRRRCQIIGAARSNATR